MRIANVLRNGAATLAVRAGDAYVDLAVAAPQLPRTRHALLERATASAVIAAVAETVAPVEAGAR